MIEVRECSKDECAEKFDGADGRNCPSCNRPFTRKLTTRGCADCLEEDDCAEVAVGARLATLSGNEVFLHQQVTLAEWLIAKYDTEHGFLNPSA